VGVMLNMTGQQQDSRLTSRIIFTKRIDRRCTRRKIQQESEEIGKSTTKIRARAIKADPDFPWQQRHLSGETCPKTGRQVWRIASQDMSNGKRKLRLYGQRIGPP
jgi:hypothetical protein